VTNFRAEAPWLCFFSLFAARFSCRDFAGFFLVSFLVSIALLIESRIVRGEDPRTDVASDGCVCLEEAL
jgi:hypothetical protein